MPGLGVAVHDKREVFPRLPARGNEVYSELIGAHEELGRYPAKCVGENESGLAMPTRARKALPFRQRRRGVESRLFIDTGQPSRDDILISSIARASAWREALCKGEALASIAARDGITVKYLGQMRVFAFLSPKRVRAILQGRELPALTTNWTRRHEMSASRAEQDRIIAQL